MMEYLEKKNQDVFVDIWCVEQQFDMSTMGRDRFFCKEFFVIGEANNK